MTRINTSQNKKVSSSVIRIYKRDIPLEEWRTYLNSKSESLKFSEPGESDPWVEIFREDEISEQEAAFYSYYAKVEEQDA